MRRGLVAVVGELDEPSTLRRLAEPLLNDPTCSRTLVRGLLVIASFGPDGRALTIRDISAQVQLSPSVVHKLVHTWVALGFLRQNPHTRRYMLSANTRPGERSKQDEHRVRHGSRGEADHA